jgi:hypothetical protein
MVRLRYSSVVKLGALFFFALFIVPSLLKLFNGSSAPLDEGSDRMLGVSDEETAAAAAVGVRVNDNAGARGKKLAVSGYDKSSWRDVYISPFLLAYRLLSITVD